MKQQVLDFLSEVIHPETGKDLVSSGMIENITINGDDLVVTLKFGKVRDPFMNSIVRQVKTILDASFPHMKSRVLTSTPTPKTPKPEEGRQPVRGINKVLMIASGKGGVGKSTVAANLAVTMAHMGYRVGLMDADIYGPSQPVMFGIEGWQPDIIETADGELMQPAMVDGVALMSVGFFISPKDALVWRGPMATSAVKQLLRQTKWDELDLLIIDMPPGTGDIHLTMVQELPIDGAVIVTTPQKISTDDARRGIAMLRNGQVAVPVVGIIENMSWFSPEELPDNRYYIFGTQGGAQLAQEADTELLAQIPLIMSIREGADSGKPAVTDSQQVSQIYREAADKIVKKLDM